MIVPHPFAADELAPWWSGLALVFALFAGGCTDSTETNPTGGSGGNDACGTESPLALGQCVEESRYETDLTFVAQERPPGSAHHQAVQDLCADRLAELGYTVERHAYGTGTNVVGVKAGPSEERVVLSAHYDHIPGCAGADDNGTGVAGLLESARVLSQSQFARTLVVACWDEEELGLVGAAAYAQRAVAAGDDIVGVFVYEMLGYAVSEPNTQRLPLGFDAVFPEATDKVHANDDAGDFIAVIGDDTMQGAIDRMDQYAEPLGVRSVSLAIESAYKNDPAFGDLRRSDHAPFWALDIPALFITDTSNFRYDAYHCMNGTSDVVENLDHAFAAGVVRMTVAAVADVLGLN